MQPCVDRQAVSEVVSGWTGIPVGKMVRDEIDTVLHARRRCSEQRVVGQDHALDAIAQRIRTSRASLDDPNGRSACSCSSARAASARPRPRIALADMLFGGERNMIVVNMSEFQEEHTVSRLIGSPPGYVGYGEGGVLTEAVRQRPYSVVLSTRWRRPTPTCWTSSTRCSTRACSRTARAG